MRRDNIFWGIVLILVGVLLYLQSQGIVSDVFRYFWPLFSILAGMWIVLGVYWRPVPSVEDTFSIPLAAVQRVNYHFSHGAGQLDITGGAPAGQAIVGTSAAGMKRRSYVNGDQLEVRVEAGPSFIPFVGPNEGVWRFQLTQEFPVLLTVESGASYQNIDLTDVLATRLAVKTGASSTNITMPARGVSMLDVEAGAASVSIRVPDVTAARIRIREGVMAVNVDTNRFPRLDSGIYQSPNYDSAQNRTEINVESGVGSVSVK